MPKRVRTPNCTHVDMDRVYGRDNLCYVCGLSPSVGFLYECRQDCDEPTLRDQILEREHDSIEATKSNLRLELETIGLSESVILTAESGHYSPSQLDKLKELKLELRQTIVDTRQANQINDAVSRLAAIAKAPFDGTFNSMPVKEMGCTFRACHSCRPYYRDRVYISFQAVLSADFIPLTRDDINFLPTKSAQTMSSIGATIRSKGPGHPLPPITLPTQTSLATSTDAPHTASTSNTDSSQLTFKTTQTDVDEISAQRRPRRRFYKMGRRSSGEIARDLTRLSSFLTRQGLKTAVQGIFRPGRESSSSGSNITLPLPRTGTARALNESTSVREFDVGALRRVRRQKERNDLRNGTYIGGFEGLTAASHRRAELSSSHLGESDGGAETGTSESSELSFFSSASEGSEVEVDGGVALTEEALEMHTPDILSSSASVRTFGHVKAAADAKRDEEDEDENEVGLQGVMTQV
ncbi:hypothetical protein ACN47E_008361 [Coniothyrium glycines]